MSKTAFYLLTLFAACGLPPRTAAAAVPLQPLIDAVEAGGRVEPPAGEYSGPVLIDKPLVLDGKNGVTIDGGHKGTVILVKTRGATIENLKIRGSGDQHNDVDAGIQVKGNFNIIQDNILDDVLFGIDLSDSQGNLVRRNNVRSRQVELGVQGDGLRLWHSNENTITDNTVCYARDSVVWYSEQNVFRHNSFCHGRYGLHFMYAHFNTVEDNDFHHNSVGIFLMYSDNIDIRKNRVWWGQGPTSMGIGFKEASRVTVENNTIYYSGRGIYLDASPLDPSSTNVIQSNELSFCGQAISFLSDWTGNEIHNNVFRNNFQQAGVNTRASINRNSWSENYWDDYEGFDRNDDGIGDTSYRQWLYSDQLWLNVPESSFFQASPVLSMVGMIERLIPFSEPVLLLQDDRPLVKPWTGKTVARPLSDPDDPAPAKRLDPFGLYKFDDAESQTQTGGAD